MTTGNCVPEFDQDPYVFDVAEDAEVDVEVGTVSATDEDTDDTLTYSIESGNTGNVFAIDDETGAITVAGALDHETTPSYTLTVKVSDGHPTMEGTDTATVTVTVTDVAENPPPAPTGVDTTLSGGTFTIEWAAVSGTDNYEVQYRTGGTSGTWSSVGTTTTTSLDYTPTGGPTCGTTYDFRVRAYGDGETYTEMWGPESGEDSLTTEDCNMAPEFEKSTYTFTVSEDAEVGDDVVTVTATDEDTNDELTYTLPWATMTGSST